MVLNNKRIPLVKLGDIVELVTSGATPTVGKKELYSNKDNGVPFFRIQNIHENHLILNDLKYVTREVHEKELCRSKISPNDILITITGRLGTATVVPKEVKEGNINQHLCLVRLKENVADPEYVSFHINSRQTHAEITQKQHGSTRIALNHKSLCSLEIGLPPLKVQKQIVAILKKASSLKQKREQANQMANKLLQAVSLQMFGDPQTNPKKWELKTLPEIVAKDKYSIKRGPFGGSLKKEFFTTTGFLVYEQFHAINNDFSKNRYFIDEAKYKELEMFKVVEGDLIISCSGVTLGRIAEVPKGALSGIINQALLKVSLDKSKMNSKYFMFLFRGKTMQETLFRLSRGSGQPNLPPMPEIKAIKFMTPPIDLQNDFSSIVEKIENIMKKQGCSTNEINQLFDSLMSKTFKGELVN
jgi:type I restriction enzyme S subunit